LPGHPPFLPYTQCRAALRHPPSPTGAICVSRGRKPAEDGPLYVPASRVAAAPLTQHLRTIKPHPGPLQQHHEFLYGRVPRVACPASQYLWKIYGRVPHPGFRRRGGSFPHVNRTPRRAPPSPSPQGDTAYRVEAPRFSVVTSGIEENGL